jgi:hypothetical protein
MKINSDYAPNRAIPRIRAFTASSSRLRAGAFVSSALSSLAEACATSSTAAANAASFTFDGFVNPLIFRTYCSAAAALLPRSPAAQN